MRKLDKIILIGFFLSGFAALTYEVAWTRSLSLVFGSSTYAFSTMLTSFMVGLALGSYIASKYVDRFKAPIALFAFVELGIGIYGLLLIPVFDKLDILYLMLHDYFQSFYPFMFSLFILSFLLMLIPTTLMGATMPIVSKIFTHEQESVGTDIGIIYSANTLGGIFGSFSAGFVLIPVVGLVKACVLAALFNIIVAFLVFLHSEKKMKMQFYSFLCVALMLGTILSTYALSPASAGVYYKAKYVDVAGWDKVKESRDIIYNKEGLYGLVTVGTERPTNVTYLAIDGRAEASTHPLDFSHQYLLAYIPMLLHSNPDRVLNIGLGGGFTLGAIENFDTSKIDCIEIDPLVAEASEAHFSEYNGNALDDPRLNLIIADARNYLYTSDEEYDIIISAPSHIWASGEAGLFTKEFYEIVKDHLAEDGVFCQWVPLYEHDPVDVKVFLSTFHSVFPYMSVWATKTDMFLIGSSEPIIIDYQSLRQNILRNEEVNSDLRVISEYAELNLVDFFLSHYVMSEVEVEKFVEGVTLNTDDHPILEFRTAKNSVYIPKENAFDSIVSFKEEEYGMPVYIPPVTGTVTRKGDYVEIDFIALRADIDDSWEEVFSGYEFVYDIPEVPYKQIAKYATFEKDGARITFQAMESEDGVEVPDILRSISSRYQYLITHEGERRVKGWDEKLDNSGLVLRPKSADICCFS